MCLRSFCVANPRASCRINPCGDKCAVEFYNGDNKVVDCTQGASQCHMERHRVMLIRTQLELMIVERNHTIMVADIMHAYMLELAPGLMAPPPPPPRCQDMEEGRGPSPPPQGGRPNPGDGPGLPPAPPQGGNNNERPPPPQGGNNNERPPPPPRQQLPPPPPPRQPNQQPRDDDDTRQGERETPNINNKPAMPHLPPNPLRPPPHMCIDRKKVCNEPKNIGPCKASVSMFYYNSKTGQCEQFTWGGCKPSANNFRNMIECTKACAEVHDMAGIYEPHCHKEHDDMRHGGYQYKQCHDNLCWCVSSDGKPVKGTLTKGKLECDENGRIASQSDSVAVCPDNTKPSICARSCHEAKCVAAGMKICVADPCNNCQVTFYKMNHEVVRCKKDTTKPKHVCDQKVEQGPCKARKPQWAFNAKSGKCEEFFYGGCRGNDNRFDTKDECVATCPESSCPADSDLDKAEAEMEDCLGEKCPTYPEAQCVIDACTGKHKFIDVVTGLDVISCTKVTGLCQRRNAKNKLKQMERAMDTSNSRPPPSMVQCDQTGKFSPKQCHGNNCWCVDEFGTEYGSVGGQGIICDKQQVTKITGEVKINANFDEIKHKMDKFAKIARATIAKHLQVSEDWITIKSVRPGSIIIEFEVANMDPDVDLPAKITRLQEEVDEGDFNMVFEGEVMPAEEMSIGYDALHHQRDMDPTPEDEPVMDMDDTSRTVFIIAVACIAAFFLILCIVGLVACCRRKPKNGSVNGSEKNLAFSNPDYASPEELKVKL